jgi:hypothetical protein
MDSVNKAQREVVVPAHIIRAVAVQSMTDPRTVRRVLAGEPTRPMCRLRVLAALNTVAARECRS